MRSVNILFLEINEKAVNASMSSASRTNDDHDMAVLQCRGDPHVPRWRFSIQFLIVAVEGDMMIPFPLSFLLAVHLSTK
jgi:hypothetical protein